VRVLHAIHDFLPRHQAGSEIYALHLCRELARRHDVTVLCADYDPRQRHGHVTWRLYDGLQVVEIANNWRCSSFAETYRPPLIADRIDHVLRAIQPDVVHVHNLLNLSFDLPLLARRRGARVVATLHDYTLLCAAGGQRVHIADQHVCHDIDTERCARCFRESPFGAQVALGRLAGDTAMAPAFDVASALARRFPRTIGRLARRAGRMPTLGVTAHEVDARLAAARSAFDQLDAVVAPSASIASEFARFGMPAAKLRTMDYGFVPLVRRAARVPSPRLRIGYVGTLVWHKGVHVLIDAVQALPRTAYELKIFGDLAVFPEYVAGLRGRARGLPIQFEGKFDQRDLGDIYRKFDVLAVPSLWLENSPLVIHEAFMAGVPVVGSCIGGISELVEHGRTGLLCDPNDARSLEAALRSLVDSPKRLDDLTVGVQTRTPVRSMTDDADAWDAIYRDVRK
jgi:glycosyltransferase involved in cell wall biosynthesis